MVTVLAIILFLVARPYYGDLYKVLFYISVPLVVLMLIVIAAGDLAGAEQIGNIIFLFLILLSSELIMARFFDKPQIKKKKR
jgi:positive regulator of sigma E activity